jgi:hypothetical protein
MHQKYFIKTRSDHYNLKLSRLMIKLETKLLVLKAMSSN